jgi:hypothetical protein
MELDDNNKIFYTYLKSPGIVRDFLDKSKDRSRVKQFQLYFKFNNIHIKATIPYIVNINNYTSSLCYPGTLEL